MVDFGYDLQAVEVALGALSLLVTSVSALLTWQVAHGMLFISLCRKFR